MQAIKKKNQRTSEIGRQFGVARSGSQIEVLSHDGQLVVRKWSSSPAARDALRKQEAKQREFIATQDKYPEITSPQVYSSKDEQHAYFDMDYVTLLPACELLPRWSPGAVERFADKLSQFIKINTEARLVSMPGEVIVQKLTQIVDRADKFDILSKYAINLIERCKETVPEKLEIPAGYEHGDLTFSNILTDHEGKKIVLIDFTISPVVTPIQDVAKLLQEITFRWSWKDKELNAQEQTRLDTNLRFIKSRVCEPLEKMHRDDIGLFTFLTIARILPYARSSGEIAWIINALNKIDSERSK